MNATKQVIIPTVWMNEQADEAATFYERAFDDAHARVLGTYPAEGLLDFQRGLEGKTLNTAIDITGPGGDQFRIQLLNASEDNRPNPSISFIVNFDPLMFADDESRARASFLRYFSEASHLAWPLRLNNTTSKSFQAHRRERS